MILMRAQRSALVRKCAQHIVVLQRAAFATGQAPIPLVLVEKHGNYAVVRMNRPPVNSLNTALMQEMDKTIKDLEVDKTIRGFILASSSEKIFSAGLDLTEVYQAPPDKMAKVWTAMQDLYLRLYTTPLAGVAAIEGQSPAGGCLFAMCCDYRIMTAGKPLIGLNETQLGLVPPTWFCDAFVNTIGHREAEKMLGLGLQVDATKAKAIGLVDEAVLLEEVFPRAQAAMEKWLAIPDMARVKTKLLMREQTAQRLRDARDRDLEESCAFAQTDAVQKTLGWYLRSLNKKN